MQNKIKNTKQIRVHEIKQQLKVLAKLFPYQKLSELQ